jgi:hypothetical protein
MGELLCYMDDSNFISEFSHYNFLLASFSRVMTIYFGGQTFLQKGLLHLSDSVKRGRKEILIRKYVMLYGKKWH